MSSTKTLHRVPKDLRDPKLPDLATALDVDRIGALIDRAERAELREPFHLTHGEITYIRYKPCTSLLVGYRFETGAGAEFLGYAKLVPASRFDDLRQKTYRMARSRSYARVIPINRLPMLFFVFPFDRKIPGLRLLTDPGKLKRFVNDALANGPDRRVSAKRSRTELLRYKPERRAVMRADLGIVDGGGDVIERRQVHLKAYADGTGERTHRVMRFLEEHSARLGGLGLARSLGYAARERVVAQEALPGEQLVLKRDGRSCVRATGAALAGLHALETGSLPVNDNQTASGLLSEVRSGATYFESIAAEEPALRMASIAERLAVRLPEARTAVVHGDFYAHQVLVNGDAVAFVDFDEGGAGDPRVDIGNFIAHLRLQSMQEPGSVETGIETSFLEGYASGRGTSDEVDWFTTACLARLAVAPFRALRPDWNREAGAILDAALKAIGS